MVLIQKGIWNKGTNMACSLPCCLILFFFYSVLFYCYQFQRFSFFYAKNKPCCHIASTYIVHAELIEQMLSLTHHKPITYATLLVGIQGDVYSAVQNSLFLIQILFYKYKQMFIL